MKYILIIIYVISISLCNIKPDINNNGRIEAIDCTMVSQYIKGTRDLTFIQRVKADVNRDGSITKEDIDLMVDIILGR